MKCGASLLIQMLSADLALVWRRIRIGRREPRYRRDIGFIVAGGKKWKGVSLFCNGSYPMPRCWQMAIAENLKHVADVQNQCICNHWCHHPFAIGPLYLQARPGGKQQREAFVVGVFANPAGRTGLSVGRGVVKQAQLAGRAVHMLHQTVLRQAQRQGKTPEQMFRQFKNGIVVGAYCLAEPGVTRPLIRPHHGERLSPAFEVKINVVCFLAVRRLVAKLLLALGYITAVVGTVTNKAAHLGCQILGEPLSGQLNQVIDQLLGNTVSGQVKEATSVRLLQLASRLESNAGPEPGYASQPNTLLLAVCGAHLQGQPLNWQLTERGAKLVACTTTADGYRLYDLNEPGVKRPALVQDPTSSQAIEVEVWQLPLEHIGSLLQGIAPPLGLGSVQLADHSWVRGFICEQNGLNQAREITHFASWRSYLNEKK